MEAEECAMQSLLKSKMINPAGGGRLGARRTEDGLRRDATATICHPLSIRPAAGSTLPRQELSVFFRDLRASAFRYLF